MLWKACQRGGRRNGGEAKNGKEKVTRRGVSLARSDNLINSCSALAHDAYCDTVGGTDDDCSGVNPPTPPMPKQDDACQAPRPYACGCNETPHKTKAQLAIEHCLETHPGDLPYCRQGHENEALCSVCGGRARSSRRTCIGRIGGWKIFAWPSASRRPRSTGCFTGSAVVSEQIRSRRLARAHALLVKSNGWGRISEVARLCGFTSDAHFSRAFRDAYGYTPRDAMTSANPSLLRQPGAAQTSSGVDEVIIDWIRQLAR